MNPAPTQPVPSPTPNAGIPQPMNLSTKLAIAAWAVVGLLAVWLLGDSAGTGRAGLEFLIASWLIVPLLSVLAALSEIREGKLGLRSPDSSAKSSLAIVFAVLAFLACPCEVVLFFRPVVWFAS